MKPFMHKLYLTRLTLIQYFFVESNPVRHIPQLLEGPAWWGWWPTSLLPSEIYRQNMNTESSRREIQRFVVERFRLALSVQLCNNKVCSCLTVDTSWLHSNRGWVLGDLKASPFANVSSLLRYAGQGRRTEEGMSSSDVFDSTLASPSSEQTGRYAEPK